LKINSVLSPASWTIIIIATLLTGYLYWFYTHFEKVFNEKDIGPIKEARVNPIYAAEKFLEKVGKKSSSHKNYSIIDTYQIDQIEDVNSSSQASQNEQDEKNKNLISDNSHEENFKLEAYDTLIIESNRVGLSENKRIKIKDWLSSGGHLILLATEIYDDELASSRDVLIDDLGLRLYENSYNTWQEDEEEEFTKVSFEGTDDVTEIHFNNHFYIQDSDGKAAFIGGNESTDFFAQYDYDEGMVTVVTDMNIWKNGLIAKHDHAMFLYQLVGGADQVWFLYNTIQPSLMSIMLDLIPLVVISFIFIILIILFSASWRKGAPRLDDERVQRKFMLHIEAAGEFSYRNDNGFMLLKALMESLDSKLRRTIHLYKKMPVAKKIEKLSQLTHIKKERLQILWQDSDLIDVSELTQDGFIQKVLLIKEIKKRL